MPREVRAVPAVAISVSKMVAVSCVELTNSVVRGAPFQRTWDVATKFVPARDRVKVAPPAAMLLGASALSVGTGLLVVIRNV